MSTTPPGYEGAELPDADALSDAWTALADVEEHVLDPIMHSVFRALNYEGEQTITFDQIGRLAAFAREIEGMAAGIQKLAKTTQEACLNDLPPIAKTGNNPHQPRFTPFGTRMHYELVS
jgi:hypothetical protein